MKVGGVFAVDRGVFEHEFFAPEPFTEREAWIWMCGTAAWKSTRVRAGRRQMISLDRGQLAFSERFLATKWRWSKTRVHRFIDRLKTEAMVITKSDQFVNLITICNYERYAFDGTDRWTKSGPEPGPEVDQKWTKEEEGKNVRRRESKKEIGRSLRSLGTRLPADWVPSLADQEESLRIGLSPQRIQTEGERFRDYWHARAGPGGVKLDWSATWRNWCRRAVENGTGKTGPSKTNLVDLAYDLADEAREREFAAGIRRAHGSFRSS